MELAPNMQVKRIEIKPSDLLEVIKTTMPDKLPEDTSIIRTVYEPTRSTIIMIVTSLSFEDVASLIRSENIRLSIVFSGDGESAEFTEDNKNG